MNQDDEVDKQFTEPFGRLGILFDDLGEVEQTTGETECSKADDQQADEEGDEMEEKHRRMKDQEGDRKTWSKNESREREREDERRDG